MDVYIPSNNFSNNVGFQNTTYKISMQVNSDLYVVQEKFIKFTQKVPWQVSECIPGNKLNKQSNLSWGDFSVKTCAVSLQEHIFAIL